LVQASDASGGVGAVASRWGIRHLGRFAGEYRKMFGELPSRTLANSLASGSDSHETVGVTDSDAKCSNS
jgi:hypothetical protein